MLTRQPRNVVSERLGRQQDVLLRLWALVEGLDEPDQRGLDAAATRRVDLGVIATVSGGAEDARLRLPDAGAQTGGSSSSESVPGDHWLEPGKEWNSGRNRAVYSSATNICI